MTEPIVASGFALVGHYVVRHLSVECCRRILVLMDWPWLDLLSVETRDVFAKDLQVERHPIAATNPKQLVSPIALKPTYLTTKTSL